MEHAWLDSLSEDWVSQAPSDTSVAKWPSLGLSKKLESSPWQSPNYPSRIPLRTQGPGAKSPFPSSLHDSSISVLGERSANDYNIIRQRLATKVSGLDKAPKNKMLGGSVSEISNGSVLRHSVPNDSPSIGDGTGTPEWKRRLIYGNVQYGEHVDLFASAATGLQDMFKPPQSAEKRDEESQVQPQHDMSISSSPPIAHNVPITTELDDLLNFEDDEEAEYPDQVTPSPSPRRPQREIRYKLNVDDSLNASLVTNSSMRRRLNSDGEGEGEGEGESLLRASSRLSVPLASNGASRKISGDTHNEHFSPILLGKHNDEDGKIDFAPLEIPADQLRERLERLRLDQTDLDGKPDSETCESHSADEVILGPESPQAEACPGGLMNARRGDSDDGSYRQRLLGSDMGVDSSEMFPEESLQASTPKQFPTFRSERVNRFEAIALSHSPIFPRVPFPSPDKGQAEAQQTAAGQSTSSPLKLFGPYDTFTNQTLLRRISQFEEAMSGRTSGRSSRQSSIQSVPEGEDQQYRHGATLSPLEDVSQFGGGDFEGYEFSGDLSYVANDDGKENVSPTSPLAPEIMLEQASPRSEPDEEPELQVRRRRHKSVVFSDLDHVDFGVPHEDLYRRGTPMRDSGLDKRRRTSPCKDPTPKRRRTLHRSDIAFADKKRTTGAASGQKRLQAGTAWKDGARMPFADAQLLARKSLLRPHVSSFSQESSLHSEQELASMLLHPNSQGRVNRSPSKTALDEEKRSGESSAETIRQPSIRTQDFVDQAAQIMAMIRNQVKQPGLASLLESEDETRLQGHQLTAPDVSDESTGEPLSRPPSREGKSISWFAQRPEDPQLLSRLKKYQELSDIDNIISSSVRSMGLAKDAIRAAQEVERMIEESSSRGASDSALTGVGKMASDDAKLRKPARSFSADEAASPLRESNTELMGRSTSQTFPSGSSRGSESRRIIMPESVSHLIPDNVGGMYLDKQNNIWIKKKEWRESTSHIVSFDDSEDDPFASIPDLTVDITNELRQLRVSYGAGDKDGGKGDGDASVEGPSFTQLHEDCTDQARNSAMAARAVDELKKLDPLVGRTTGAKDGAEHHAVMQDEGVSHVASTIRRRNLTISFSSPIASIIQDMLPEDLDSLEDDPDMSGPIGAGVAAPLASILAQGPSTPSTTPSGSRTVNRLSLRGWTRAGIKARPKAMTKAGTKAGQSPRHRSFIPRPVSRIDEQDEESTEEISVDSARDQQLSVIQDKSLLSQKSQDGGLTFIVNRTPVGKSLAVPGDDSFLIGQNIGRLSLTPLSEFTVNHPDQSFGLEVSYVMGQRHMATGNGSKRVLSMTIRELVDKLAEVEPFEPYWEDMTALDLHDRQLRSLHMLDEFCGKVIVLDASGNALVHLEGIPSCVRQLKVSRNMLTELTSWDHLLNLQYVDISGNEVKSLSALRGLVHLRSLRADGNRLTSLDGLESHDGLLSLRARDNLIEELNAEDLRLERLTELDLQGNRITLVSGLETLPSLAQLDLSSNRLQVLSIDKAVTSLRALSLNDNELTSLDLRHLPKLQSLHLDRNRIQHLSGFRHVQRIDSLSLREQQGDAPLDLAFLSSACEVRKLFLSGNYLKSFQPRTDFLNLQLLELANCGLQDLPSELGQMMPNLRMLNLNFNAISQLTPLRYIPRLKKLLVAGNRLVDSTAVTELLTDFPHLTQLDLRDNPMTQGFYPPLRVLVTAVTVGSGDLFTLAESDVERDATFARRLDEPTRLRRRLHEVVFVASCKRLRKLDGLGVRRGEVLARDALLQMLIDEGLVPELEETLVAEESASRIKEHEAEMESTSRIREVTGSTEEPEGSRSKQTAPA